MTEKQERFKVSEVYSSSGYIIKDISTGNEYSVMEGIAKIMNDIEDLKRRIIG